MRTIKFRGKRIDDGVLVFGNCLHQYPNGKVAISHVTKLALTFVEPGSVAQYAFTDSNGHEVYTGDTVVSEDGTEYTVKLVPIAENENEYVRLDTELDNRDFVLKEQNGD